MSRKHAGPGNTHRIRGLQRRSVGSEGVYGQGGLDGGDPGD